MYVRGYLQGSENDRVVTIAYNMYEFHFTEIEKSFCVNP